MFIEKAVFLTLDILTVYNLVSYWFLFFSGDTVVNLWVILDAKMLSIKSLFFLFASACFCLSGVLSSLEATLGEFCGTFKHL